MSSELETNIVAVERVKEYSETPTEVCIMWLKFGVRFFGKIQIRILVSKNGFCVSLPKSENGLITD